MGLATKQNNLTNPITGTGTTNFYQSLQGASTLGNSILRGGGILNVSGSEYSLQVLQQMGSMKQDYYKAKIGFCLEQQSFIILDI
jgi:hypothetical protein